jgi:hypothetical protein
MMKRTCLFVLGFVAWLSPQCRAEPPFARRTIDYVQKLQFKDGKYKGSFGASENAGPSLGATVAAVRALRYLGGEVPDPDGCARFVDLCYAKDSGGFAGAPEGLSDVLTTSIGLMGVVDLKMNVDKYADGGVKYLEDKVRTFEDVRIAAAALEALHRTTKRKDLWLHVAQNVAGPDGGTPGPRTLGGQLVAILRLTGETELAKVPLPVAYAGTKPADVTNALLEGQFRDGGWTKDGVKTSDLDTIYRVMRAVHMLKLKPDVARLRTFLGRCLNADGGYGVSPGQPSTIAATYNAAIIYHWLEPKD